MIEESKQEVQQVQQPEVAASGLLASTWRPATMLIFVALFVARWLGFAKPDLSEAEVLALWAVVQYSMGGYVVGRSLEKIVPVLATALGALKK